MSLKSIPDVAAALRAFAAERDWDQFHTPKNLAMAMSAEAAEVMEHFLWLKDGRAMRSARRRRRRSRWSLRTCSSISCGCRIAWAWIS